MIKKIDLLDLGFLGYMDTYRIQKQLHKRREKNEIPDTLILVKHPDVVTVGRAYAKGSILDRRGLGLLKIPIVEIDRGGGVTCHGPGQIIMYPIFDLKGFKKDIRFYLDKLESVIIELLHLYDIESHRKLMMRGVWVEDKKIASIGIGVSKWITYHGAALNVDANMKIFSLIKPCGLEPDRMISMQKILNTNLDKEGIKKELIRIFRDVFNKPR